MQQAHIMVDLETAGTSNNAPIMSIGAVAFSVHKEIDHIYRPVDLCSSAQYQDPIDANTVLWWLGQSEDARRDLLRGAAIGNPLPHALQNLSDFIGKFDVQGVWGNGATFDNVILRNAYESVGQECPWSFREDRCFRTMKGLDLVPQPEREGTHHNALDDAIYQAQWLQQIMRVLQP